MTFRSTFALFFVGCLSGLGPVACAAAGEASESGSDAFSRARGAVDGGSPSSGPESDGEIFALVNVALGPGGNCVAPELEFVTGDGSAKAVLRENAVFPCPVFAHTAPAHTYEALKFARAAGECAAWTGETKVATAGGGETHRIRIVDNRSGACEAEESTLVVEETRVGAGRVPNEVTRYVLATAAADAGRD